MPTQLSITQIAAAIDREIRRAEGVKNVRRLAELQIIAGYLMRPAENVRDRETATRFRVLAAHAANAREDIERGGEER